ncbi:MAG TPA: pyruvate kinase, partial [bacterium]|nr:pyruvate kinase [bacterium]
MKPRHMKTKIVCTIGPASRSGEKLARLMGNGMSVARLNFAHGTLPQHAADIKIIREVASQERAKCPIFIDLPGPKIRVGKLKQQPMYLHKGHVIYLTSRKILRLFHESIPVDYPHLTQSVRLGGLIYLNDGFIQLKVLEIRPALVKCEVLVGGPLLSHKGLNIPDGKIFAEPVTEEDLKYVDFGLEHGIDLFGVSFIEKAEDILKIKAYAKKKGKRIHTIAKIERAEAVKNLDGILKVTDMVRVARGDLGVQIPIEEVPL